MQTPSKYWILSLLPSTIFTPTLIVSPGEKSVIFLLAIIFCIAKKNRDLNSSFTVRKISFGEGVERTFALYSPNVDSIKVIRSGKVRRAKLYYLRDRKGKSARIAEKIKKKIGVDVSVKTVEPKDKVVEAAKEEAPKVETKDDKSTNEKK